MAHITEFRIEGLAGRTHPLSVKLDRYVNVFYGLNGCGKTSLLRILASAMRGEGQHLQHVPFHAAEVSIYSNQQEMVFTRTFTKENLSHHVDVADSGEAFVVYEPDLIVEGSRGDWSRSDAEIEVCGPRNTHWKHRYLPISRLQLSPRTIPSSPRSSANSELELERRFAKHVLEIWGRYHSGVMREVREAQEEGLARVLNGVLAPSSQRPASEPEVDPQEAYESVTEFLSRQPKSEKGLGPFGPFAKRYLETGLLQRVVSDIVSVQRKVHLATAPTDKLEALLSGLYGGNKTLKFSHNSISVSANDEVEIPLEALSSGEKQIMRLLLEVLLVEQSSLIVDEPELSLHIDWQRHLVENFRTLNPDAQIIAATHSPEFLAGVNDEDIIAL